MTADAELLQSAVSEVARLLRADGAMIYLVDEATGQLRFAHDAGITDPDARRLIHDLTLPVGVGMFGTAVASRRMTVTDDYPADQRFTHSEVADRIVTAARMRSMAVAPLLANGRPIGAWALRVAARPQRAADRLLRALADPPPRHRQPAAGCAAGRLRGALSEPGRGLARRRLGHRPPGTPRLPLRDGGAADRAPADELLGQHWSVMVVPEDREGFQRRWDESKQQGDEERRVRFRIQRADGTPRTVELRGRERVMASGIGAHGSIRDISELAGLEDDLRAQAQELAPRRDQQTVARDQRAASPRWNAIGRCCSRWSTPQSGCSSRMAPTSPCSTRMRPNLRPHVVAGGVDGRGARGLPAQERFPIGGGINGLAAQTGVPVWTDDYRVDPRMPHTEDDSPDRLDLGAMAVAPLRGVRGEIIGTLAISYRDPRESRPRDRAAGGAGRAGRDRCAQRRPVREAARQRAPLSTPRRPLARPGLRDRCAGPSDLPLVSERTADGPGSRRAGRPSLRRRRCPGAAR